MISLKLSSYSKGFAKEYKIYFISLFFVAIIAAVFENLVAYNVKIIIDTIADNKGEAVGYLIGLFALYKLLQHGMFFISRLLDIKYKPKLITKLTNDIYNKTIKHSLSWFDSHMSGEIADKINSFQVSITYLITNLFRATTIIAVVIVGVILIIKVHYLPALILAIFLLIYSPILFVLLNKQMKLQENYTNAAQKTTGIINDSISNIFAIKIIGNILSEYKLKLRPALLEREEWDRITRKYDAYVVDNVDTIVSVIMASIQIWVTTYLYQTGQITAGGFAFIALITLRVHGDIDQLINYILFGINPQIAQIKASYSFINEEYACQDKDNAYELENVKGEIEFRNVSFGYGSVNFTQQDNKQALNSPLEGESDLQSKSSGGSKNISTKKVLQNEVIFYPSPEFLQNSDSPSRGELKKDLIFSSLNLHIKAGEKVGLVGQSGAGKTTLIKSLLRYFDINSGDILIDGHKIADITQDSLRNNIAMIPQDITMFHRSILENLQIAKYDATLEEIMEACKKAKIHNDIINMEKGYDSVVGERGVKVSGGQRQRIAIARAILKDAPILILDEATSSLDSKTEKDIQESLNILIADKNKTVLAIAHRLSTLKHMDRIIVLDKGKIVEEGSHDELLANPDSLYKRLWELQEI